VGRNIEDNGITKEEALFMLDNDILRVSEELKRTFHWYRHINDVRKMVLIDMCFNLGMPRFKKFKRMIAALERTDYIDAAAEMLDSKWARQVGNRAIELADLMRGI
jgi:lysozyme